MRASLGWIPAIVWVKWSKVLTSESTQRKLMNKKGEKMKRRKVKKRKRQMRW